MHEDELHVKHRDGFRKLFGVHASARSMAGQKISVKDLHKALQLCCRSKRKAIFAHVDGAILPSPVIHIAQPPPVPPTQVQDTNPARWQVFPQNFEIELLQQHQLGLIHVLRAGDSELVGQHPLFRAWLQRRLRPCNVISTHFFLLWISSLNIACAEAVERLRINSDFRYFGKVLPNRSTNSTRFCSTNWDHLSSCHDSTLQVCTSYPQALLPTVVI